MKQSPPENDNSTPTKRRFARKLCRWCCFLLIVVAFLPSLLTVTGSHSRILRWIDPRLAAVTEFDELRLHWWSPIECRKLQILNTRAVPVETPPLLTAESVATKDPLWQVMYRLGRGIEIHLEQPELNLIVTKDGSNVSDALTDLFGASESDGTDFPVCIDIRNGCVHVVDIETAADKFKNTPLSPATFLRRTLVSGIQCRVSTLDRDAALPEISLIARQGDFSQTTAGGRPSHGGPRVAVRPRVATRLDHLGADFSVPALSPDSASQDSDGVLPTLEIHSAVDDESGTRAIRFMVRYLDLKDLQPLIALMLPETHCAGTVSVGGEVHLLGRDLHEGVALKFAARAVEVHWRQQSWARGDAIQLDTATAEGSIAVAEDGIVVTDLSAECPLAELRGDGEIRFPFDQPLESILAVRVERTVVERESALRKAEAAAAGQVNLQGHLDLVSLCRMLPRTLRLREEVDLREGILQFFIMAQPAAGDSGTGEEGTAGLDWHAVVESTPLIAHRAGRPIRWDSPIRVDASGWLGLNGAGLREAVLSGDFGHLDVTPKEQRWEIRGHLNFDELWNNAARCLSIEPPGIRGDLTLETSVAVLSESGQSVAQVGSSDSGTDASQSAAVIPSVALHFGATHLQADNVRLQSDSILVRTGQPLMNMFDGTVTLEGRGDAIRSIMAPWLACDWMASATHVSARLQSAPPDRLRISVQLQPGQIASGSPRMVTGSALRISQGKMVLDLDSDSTADHYVIRDALLQLPGLEVRLSGTLDAQHGWMNSALTADTKYDLGVLSQMLPDNSDGLLRFTGRSREQLTVRGAPAFWNGRTPEGIDPFLVTGRLSWESVHMYGLQLGPGSTALQFSDGRLRTEPIRCSLNQSGELRTMVICDVPGHRLELAPGSRVKDLSLNPELCRRWLGYVTPFLAHASSISGTVSARVSTFHWDWQHPDASVIQGTVDVQHVTGQAGSSILSLLQAIDALRPGRRSVVRDVSMPAQQITCEMRNGMITHDEVRLSLGGYDLRSQGAVGLNQQINLTLNVPLERSDEARSGRTVAVPVYGTVTHPQIDAGRMLQDAGTQRIQGEIDRQLDRGLNRLLDALR